MKRQVHLADVEEVAIRVRVETLKKGRYLGTSPAVPGLVAEGFASASIPQCEIGSFVVASLQAGSFALIQARAA